jgi:response regulator RpfG family c-di-GMP phosphodiesterase
MVTTDMAQPDVRVLVVHSDPADLAVLASVVAAHAFDLRVLESSERLTAEVIRYQPDAVVFDVVQRDSDGYALCLALKTDPVTAGVAVILTGSLDGPEARRRAFAAGCDDFLEKPIHRHVLAYRLRSFARLRRAWQRDAIPQLARMFRLLDLFDAVTRNSPHRPAPSSRAEAIEILRRDAECGGIDPVLLAAFERWLGGSEKQPHQVEP